MTLDGTTNSRITKLHLKSSYRVVKNILLTAVLFRCKGSEIQRDAGDCLLLMLQVCLYTGGQEVGGASSERKVCSLHLKCLKKVDTGGKKSAFQ